MTAPLGRAYPLHPSALVPVAGAALAVLLCAALGLTQRSFAGTALEDKFYGFFFRGYPLFLFAAVYGVLRIVMAATAPGRRKILRLGTAPLGLALFLGACFYPTFGGIVLRSGFGTGSMTFLTGQTAGLSLALGAGATALTFGLALGIGTALAAARLEVSRRAAARALMSFLALWLGVLVFLAPQRFGLDVVADFPLRPLAWTQAGAISVLVALALLPHALVTAAAVSPPAAAPVDAA